MNILIREVLALIGLGGLVLMISFVTLTKMALGAVLTLVGAFFPTSQADTTDGQATIQMSKAKAIIKGSLRYGVIAGGIVLLFGSIFSGIADVRDSKASHGDFIATSSLSQDERLEMMRKILKSICDQNPDGCKKTTENNILHYKDNLDAALGNEQNGSKPDTTH